MKMSEIKIDNICSCTGIFQDMLYHGVEVVKIDIYYNEGGHPKYVHDEFGALAIDDFRSVVINEIAKRNSTNKIWRASTDAFAVMHKDSNCGSFTVDFKGIKHDILKKTIQLNLCGGNEREWC
jgi:hypothetical protein